MNFSNFISKLTNFVDSINPANSDNLANPANTAHSDNLSELVNGVNASYIGDFGIDAFLVSICVVIVVGIAAMCVAFAVSVSNQKRLMIANFVIMQMVGLLAILSYISNDFSLIDMCFFCVLLGFAVPMFNLVAYKIVKISHKRNAHNQLTRSTDKHN